MRRKQPRWQPTRIACALGLVAGTCASAHAVTFNVGELEGQFDSQLSVGASWSVRGDDPDLIAFNNGGDGLAPSSDDGHLNFKRGETFSKIFKGVHDLELRYGDSGVFVRGKYWYDFELKDEQRLFKDIDDSNRKQAAQASGAEILDAFLYHNYAIDDLPGSVRLGKQVVSWGESTFILNSINSINPIDVAAFRRPGAEIKEGLIPVNMFYVSQSLSENLSAELFYQLEWDQTVVDNCGTFFAQQDVAADGCDHELAVLLTQQQLADAGFAGVVPALQANGVTWGTPDEGVIVRRGGDRDARDGGQWGSALRYYFAPLDTEFGAYFLNYHSRTPFFSATAPDAFTYGVADLFGPAAPLVVAGNSSYFLEYPEDIRLYGLSFSTTLPSGTAWSGEISYRPNAPVQINTTDILYAGLTPLTDPQYDNASILSATPGRDLHGYRRKEITQLQTTFIHFFDQVMGASRLTLLGEVGVVHIGGLDHSGDVRYGRDQMFGPGPLPSGACPILNSQSLGNNPNAENVSRYCENDGFATSTAWGYRARAIWEYPNAFAGVTLKPSLSWSHDVEGYGPNGLFNEGAKAVSLGLDAEYQSTYTASLSYTDFFGGQYNTSIDRDFVALSLGVSF
ncbi:DUF1302 domain-containing protein [Pseudomonas sp. PL-6]